MSGTNLPARRPRWRRPLQVLIVLSLVAVAAWQARIHGAAWQHLKHARAALQRDDPVEARLHLEQVLETWPRSGEAHFLMARSARQTGDLDVARKHLEAADQFGNAKADIDLERDLIQAQSGYLAEVESTLVTYVNDGHVESAQIIAVLVPPYLAEFRIVEAGALTAKWVELRPDSAKAWAYRADVLERLRKKEEAIAALRRLNQLTPDDRAARLNLARMLLETRQAPDEAAGHLEWLLAADPANPAVLVRMAACRDAQGRTDEAVAILDRVIAAAPGDAKALHERGRLELNRGRPAAAAPLLRRAAELDPSDVELLYTIFLCTQQTGTPAEARAAEERWRRCDEDLKRVGVLARAIATSPQDPGLRREIGELFLRNGRAVEGLRWLESALRVSPDHAPTHRVLAEYYDRIGRPDLARRHHSLATGQPH